jgi:TfoX/Sxy family transcriptional regulator of competence genes
LSKQGTLSLRLPDGPREAFLKKYKTRLCSQYGVVQKEYVEVPDALLRKTSELKQYFAVSYQHVKSLKPKPSVAKKKPA